MIDKSEILNKIKEHLNIGTHKEFAEFLNIKATTLSMWHKRNTLDIELIFKKCEWLNAEWLITGKGEMLKERNKEATKSNDKDQYIMELQRKHIEKLEAEITELKKVREQGAPYRIASEPDG